MIHAEIKNQEGELLEVLQLPETPYEIKLPNYVDLLVKQEEHKEFLSEATGSYEDKLQTAICYAEQVAAFCESENILGNNIIKLGKEQDIDLTISFVAKLRNYIWCVIKEYKQGFRTNEDYEFEYKGEKYYCKRVWGDVIKGNVSFEELTTVEGIEALEVFRWISGKKDETGSIRQSGWTKLLAILARKKNEKFPTRKSEIQRFLDKRMRHFFDVPFPVAMDVVFWFLKYHSYLKKKSTLNFSSSRQKLRSKRSKKISTQNSKSEIQKYSDALDITT